MFEYPEIVARLIRAGERQQAVEQLRVLKGLSPAMAHSLVDDFSDTSLVEESANDVSDITSAFLQNRNVFRRDANDNDCLVYPKISESKKAAARQNFGSSLGMENDETILFIRDTSWWNTVDQGLVITDKRIYVIPDNDNPNDGFAFSWSEFDNVEYRDLSLSFLNSGTESYLIGLNYFFKNVNDNTCATIGSQLARALSEISANIKSSLELSNDVDDQINSLIDAGKYDDAVKALYAAINTYPQYSSWYYKWLGRVYYIGLKDFDSAIRALNQAYENAGTEDISNLADIQYLRYSVLLNQGRIKDAREAALFVAIYGDDTTLLEETKLTRRHEAIDDFHYLDEEYIKTVADMPYHQRKLLYIVDSYTDLDQDSLLVFGPTIASHYFSFPIGHPKANQLYVGHPYITGQYLPYEDYQLTFVEDQIREFCELAQNLGAKEIKIECLNSTSNDSNDNGNRNISGQAGRKGLNGEGSFSHSYKNHLVDSISRNIELHQKFPNNTSKKIPDNLVWFEQMPGWKRFANQRLNGDLQYHKEFIQTRKSQMVDGNDLVKVNGEIKSLISNASGEYENSNEYRYELQEDATISITVYFSSSESEQNTEAKSLVSESSSISSEEQEYIAELKECLVNGEISDSERRLLNKIRSKLGISEARAAELEQNLCVTQLTEDEQEYLDAFKDAMEDGVISDAERRLLNKIKRFNDISDERAAEIEKMV